EYYKTLNNKTDKIRVKMLLDYLMDHEKKLEKNIERIEETIPPKVLKTWFKYTLCEDLRKDMQLLHYRIDEISVEELIRMAIQFDDCLIKIYKKIVLNSDIPEIREIFTNLSELEDHEKRRFVIDSTRMYDI
ncbi:MAG: hypothetical protein PHS99_07650, partial [Candidatus Marinimicrobia bacterium]|nr:hypothetical protein [Candidatus Neomarinimicrobiota bacterium]